MEAEVKTRKVYYVTAFERSLLAEFRAAEKRGDDAKPPPCHDLASFFDPEAAEKHKAKLHNTWAEAEVEEREEDEESLHASHGGKRGAPASP